MSHPYLALCGSYPIMKDGMIVQSGRYNYLLDSGLDFTALVAAHDTSMELVEMGTTCLGKYVLAKHGSLFAFISSSLLGVLLCLLEHGMQIQLL
nr:abc transporter c family member 14 [Quercus suber]